MLTFSNLLSLSRAGLALLFLSENVYLRLLSILLAMLSDFFDGYLARKTGHTTYLGTLLDPIMDKCYVFFVGVILLLEHRLAGREFGALISRDVSLLCFAIYLLLIGKFKGYRCEALLWGKIITVAQFLTLIGLTLSFIFPGYVYLIFIVLACFAFAELFVRQKKGSE